MSESKENLEIISDALTSVTEQAVKFGLRGEVAELMLACASFLDNNGTDLNALDISTLSNDDVNHPSHYKVHAMECIDEIVTMLGVEGAIQYCKGCYIKYRYRAGNKGSESDAVKDAKKSDWYIAKAEELANTACLFGKGN